MTNINFVRKTMLPLATVAALGLSSALAVADTAQDHDGTVMTGNSHLGASIAPLVTTDDRMNRLNVDIPSLEDLSTIDWASITSMWQTSERTDQETLELGPITGSAILGETSAWDRLKDQVESLINADAPNQPDVSKSEDVM